MDSGDAGILASKFLIEILKLSETQNKAHFESRYGSLIGELGLQMQI